MYSIVGVLQFTVLLQDALLGSGEISTRCQGILSLYQERVAVEIVSTLPSKIYDEALGSCAEKASSLVQCATKSKLEHELFTNGTWC